MEARLGLHQLDEICEDQRAAVQDWVDAVETCPCPRPAAPSASWRRWKYAAAMCSNTSSAWCTTSAGSNRTPKPPCKCTSVQSNRANDIMRTLTTITAIFLPLNLIAAIFGMNFDFIPWIHKEDGFWWAIGVMALIFVALIVFSYKRYLTRTGR